MKLKRSSAGNVIVFIGLAVNLTLFFVKFGIGMSANSISIYADSLNNLLDSVGCAVGLAGLRLVRLGATRTHPFGFGRAEKITDFVISVSVCIAAFYFGYMSLQRLMYPVPVWYTTTYVLILGMTVLVKAVMAFVNLSGAKKLSSGTLRAMGIDCVLDFFITLSTVAALIMSGRSGYSFDGLAGIAVAVVMMAEGVKLVAGNVSELIGKKDEKLCSEALKILEKHEISDIIDINNHSYGDRKVFTVTVSGDLPQDRSVYEDFERVNAEIYFRGTDK